ncbi:hypothetical protein OPV22_007864 [Ensete ventricosum]|uniref:Uncharacterized protein n=1 Tax=Ensete ventricosum TaxID=4639 RepID=A0AAV8RFP3_ENSVE|nr:hypothetical protein OPV22_007864 [Ensete ventricosum]
MDKVKVFYLSNVKASSKFPVPSVPWNDGTEVLKQVRLVLILYYCDGDGDGDGSERTHGTCVCCNNTTMCSIHLHPTEAATVPSHRGPPYSIMFCTSSEVKPNLGVKVQDCCEASSLEPVRSRRRSIKVYVPEDRVMGLRAVWHGSLWHIKWRPQQRSKERGLRTNLSLFVLSTAVEYNCSSSSSSILKTYEGRQHGFQYGKFALQEQCNCRGRKVLTRQSPSRVEENSYGEGKEKKKNVEDETFERTKN